MCHSSEQAAHYHIPGLKVCGLHLGWGTGGIAPLIHNPVTRWRWLDAMPPMYPLDRRHRKPQKRSESCGEDRNLLHLSGFEPKYLGPPARILVVIPGYVL